MAWTEQLCMQRSLLIKEMFGEDMSCKAMPYRQGGVFHLSTLSLNRRERLVVEPGSTSHKHSVPVVTWKKRLKVCICPLKSGFWHLQPLKVPTLSAIPLGWLSYGPSYGDLAPSNLRAILIITFLTHG